MPKLLYILRTSSCAGNSLLSKFDNILRRGLSKILNIDVTDSQWTQASLPVQMGELGVRSACTLAPSAFLASAAVTLSLQNAILPEELRKRGPCVRIRPVDLEVPEFQCETI